MSTTPPPRGEWWEAPPRPVLFLAIGFALGPQGLDLLHPRVIALIDPVIPVALAAMGILAPLTPRRRGVLLDLVLVIAVAAALLVFAGDPAMLDAVAVRGWRAIEAAGAALLVGVAGLLLLTRTASPTERRVFVLGLLLVLGGLADLASIPALATGAIAAAIWRLAPGAREPAKRDVEYVSRPLAAGLLLLIGAQLTMSGTILALSGLLLVLALLSRRMGAATQSLPGVFAICVAVDLARSLHADFVPLVAATALTVVVIQLGSLLGEAEPAPTTIAGSAAS